MPMIRAAIATALVLLAGLAPAGFARPAAAQSIRSVFDAVTGSVVVIRAKGRDVTATGPVKFTEVGSGVLVSTDGKIMTAAHVVHAMDEIAVEFLTGEAITARVTVSEPAADLSLLQLERLPANIRPATLANSDTVGVGDQVIVVGAPYGLSHALSVGWISARWAPNTIYKAMPLAEFFQTDAVINTGNSGGPMFNMAGQVIGIVSHNISKSGGSEGLGFAVTSNAARRLLLEEPTIWSGLEGRILSNELADLLNLPPGSSGYLVKTVAKGSPAEAIGIRGGNKVATIDGEQVVLGGDILLTVQGITLDGLSNYQKIREAFTHLPKGGRLTVKVLRAGKVLELAGEKP